MYLAEEVLSVSFLIIPCTAKTESKDRSTTTDDSQDSEGTLCHICNNDVSFPKRVRHNNNTTKNKDLTMNRFPKMTLENTIGLFTSEQGTALYEQRNHLDKIKNNLMKFGLSSNQAKVYIFLGKYGPKTAPEVCKSLELPRTETYSILGILQNLGIVVAQFSQPTKFEALPLDKVIQTLANSEKERVDILLQNEKEMVKLWDSIPIHAVETSITKVDKIQMLQGAAHIHTKIREMISNAKEEFYIFCSPKDFARFYHADLIKLLVDSPTFEKIIISPSHTMPEITDELNRERIKVMPNGKTDNLCFMLMDSKETLLFLRNANHPSHNTAAIWTDSKSMADCLRILFDFSWQISETLY